MKRQRTCRATLRKHDQPILVNEDDFCSDTMRIRPTLPQRAPIHKPRNTPPTLAVPCNTGSKPLRDAFAAGARAAGWDVLTHDSADAPFNIIDAADFTLAVGLNDDDLVNFNYAEAVGSTPIVLELGYFRRAESKHRKKGGAEANFYYQVSLGGIGYVPQTLCESDRFDALGLLAGDSASGDHVLVVGQKPMDAQHRMTKFELNAWAAEVIDVCINRNVKVFYRPHPGDVADTTKEVLGSIGQMPDEVPLETAILEAAAVITINSTVGCDAIRLGTPLICHQDAYYSKYASNTIDRVVMQGDLSTRRLPIEYQEEFLNKIAYAQWTLNEIAAGEPHEFLLTEVYNASQE